MTVTEMTCQLCRREQVGSRHLSESSRQQEAVGLIPFYYPDARAAGQVRLRVIDGKGLSQRHLWLTTVYWTSFEVKFSPDSGE